MSVILISGGSDGFGKAMARELARADTVVIFSPDEQKTKAAADAVGCAYTVGDVRDYARMQQIVADIVDEYGQLDCVINNAGLFITGELDDNEPEHVQQVIEVNTLGVINLTKAALPQLKKQKSGRIININSQGGLHAKAERSVYGASKWAITGFTKSLQQELSSYGIGVTDVYPGKMSTDIFQHAGVMDKDLSDALDPAEAAKMVAHIVALPESTWVSELGVRYLEQQE